MIDRYFTMIQETLSAVQKEQQDQLLEAAEILAKTVAGGGLIYIYGSGHAHMAAEDLFYRAGGLACVRPIFVEPLMLHEGAVTSSKLEKKEGYLRPWLEALPISPTDCFIVVSSSGRNATPIDTALFAKEAGCPVITISGWAYSKSAESGHSSGRRLLEAGDVNLDNRVPVGDACLEHPGLEVRFSPISSIINLTMLQAVTGECIRLCLDRGVAAVPVFKSGNVAGGAEYNRHIIEQYQERIPYLK